MTKAATIVIVGLVLGGCGGSRHAPPAILVTEPDAGARPAAPPKPTEKPPVSDAAPPADAAPAIADAGPGKPAEVHGSVTLSVERHCGGAAPPRGEAGATPPAPAGGRKLYVESGSKKVATVTTDGRGAFSLTLSPGDYCLVDAARADDRTTASKTIDGTCLTKWKKDCDVTFRVPRAEPIELALVKPCEHPCYDGPRPK